MVTPIVIIVAVLAVIAWGSTRKTRMGHWMRVVVMFLSGGFIFPHALTEGDEAAQTEAKKGAGVQAK